MTQLRVVMTGDEQQLFQALQKVIAQSDKTDESFKRTEKTSNAAEQAAIRAAKEQAKSAREGARLADDLNKQNETLTDSYQRRKAAIEAAGAAGLKSESDVKRAVDQLKLSVQQEAAAAKQAEQVRTEAARKGTAAYKVQQEEIRKGVTKVRQLAAENRTLEDQYTQLKSSIKTALKAGEISADQYKPSLRQLKNEHDELNAKQKKSFGSSSIAQVGKYAASFLSVTAAITVVREALEFFNDEKEKALGTTDSLSDVRRSLRQISKGDFDQLESKADSLTQFGVDRVSARQLVFDARSTGFENEEATVARADPVIKIEDGAAFAGEFRKFFAGDNLSIEQAFNTALAGAAESKFNISQLLPLIRTAAQGALKGGESSDVIAATSVLADNFGVQVGDRLKGLGSKLALDDRTTGLNLIDAVQELRNDPELRGDILKDSSELLQIFAKFDERFSEIVTADKRVEAEQRKTGESGLLGKAIREAFDGNTQSGQIESARRAAIAAKAENDRQKELAFSVQGSTEKAFRDRSDAALTATGANLPSRFVSDKVNQFGNFLGLDPSITAGINAGTSGFLFGGSGGSVDSVVPILEASKTLSERQTNALESIEKNLSTTVGVE